MKNTIQLKHYLPMAKANALVALARKEALTVLNYSQRHAGWELDKTYRRFFQTNPANRMFFVEHLLSKAWGDGICPHRWRHWSDSERAVQLAKAFKAAAKQFLFEHTDAVDLSLLKSNYTTGSFTSIQSEAFGTNRSGSTWDQFISDNEQQDHREFAKFA